MKKIIGILIISALLFSSCDYLRKKGILGNKEYTERLENTIKDDSLEFQAQLERLKHDSQAKIINLAQ